MTKVHTNASYDFEVGQSTIDNCLTALIDEAAHAKGITDARAKIAGAKAEQAKAEAELSSVRDHQLLANRGISIEQFRALGKLDDDIFHQTKQLDDLTAEIAKANAKLAAIGPCVANLLTRHDALATAIDKAKAEINAVLKSRERNDG